MLYLTRKVGESIVINDDIELTVVEVRGKSIKLGMTFPQDVSVYRREVFDRIQAEKQGKAAVGNVATAGGGANNNALTEPAAEATPLAAAPAGSTDDAD